MLLLICTHVDKVSPGTDEKYAIQDARACLHIYTRASNTLQRNRHKDRQDHLTQRKNKVNYFRVLKICIEMPIFRESVRFERLKEDTSVI